ncbi:hypothetical protein Tco_0587577 [Tanacetum coccineum]
MVLRKPFVKETGLVYDKDKGTVMFEKEGEKIIFNMPHKMEMFKHIDKDILKMDNIPSFIITDDDGEQEKTSYSDSLNLGPAYRRDESVTKCFTQGITNRITYRKFFKKNECEIFTVAGDGIGNFLDGVAPLVL